MYPQSGQLRVGDLVVKVGGAVVWDRCHLNVTTIIKNLSTQDKVSHSRQQCPCCIIIMTLSLLLSAKQT